MNTIELDGLTFAVAIEQDCDMREPWRECDGHGEVSEWRRTGYDGRPHKAPGERVLCTDRGSYRTYDFAGAVRMAVRDGWGLSRAQIADWTARAGRAPTAREIAAAAVEQDFDRLRRWCNGDWCYCGVVVTLLDIGGQPTDETESCWGIESDCEDYLEETARELAGIIAARIGTRDRIPARPTEYVVREVTP